VLWVITDPNCVDNRLTDGSEDARLICQLYFTPGRELIPNSRGCVDPWATVPLAGLGQFKNPLCGLVVRAPGYRSRGPEFDSPALPDVLISSGSGAGSTQPCEDNWGATWTKKYQLLSRKSRLTAVGIHCGDHAKPSTHKSLHQFRRQVAAACSVSIVHLWTNSHQVFLFCFYELTRDQTHSLLACSILAQPTILWHVNNCLYLKTCIYL
jgi:hypothetical protein